MVSRSRMFRLTAGSKDLVEMRQVALSAHRMKVAGMLLKTEKTSLTYGRNSARLNIDPCGTPALMERGLEILPFTLTCFQLCRYDVIH